MKAPERLRYMPCMSFDSKGTAKLGPVRDVLITFVCYGRHLRGCESGSVDFNGNVPAPLPEKV
jgi:hypothetical protein